MIKNRIVIFAATFLVVCFFFLAIPDKGYSQFQPNCCMISEDSCRTQLPGIGCDGMLFFVSTCNTTINRCVPNVGETETQNVPTLSQWGLIATAGLLGFVGFVVVRRRKAAA